MLWTTFLSNLIPWGTHCLDREIRFSVNTIKRADCYTLLMPTKNLFDIVYNFLIKRRIYKTIRFSSAGFSKPLCKLKSSKESFDPLGRAILIYFISKSYRASKFFYTIIFLFLVSSKDYITSSIRFLD